MSRRLLLPLLAAAAAIALLALWLGTGGSRADLPILMSASAGTDPTAPVKVSEDGVAAEVTLTGRHLSGSTSNDCLSDSGAPDLGFTRSAFAGDPESAGFGLTVGGVAFVAPLAYLDAGPGTGYTCVFDGPTNNETFTAAVVYKPSTTASGAPMSGPPDFCGKANFTAHAVHDKTLATGSPPGDDLLNAPDDVSSGVTVHYDVICDIVTQAPPPATASVGTAVAVAIEAKANDGCASSTFSAVTVTGPSLAGATVSFLPGLTCSGKGEIKGTLTYTPPTGVQGTDEVSFRVWGSAGSDGSSDLSNVVTARIAIGAAVTPTPTASPTVTVSPTPTPTDGATPPTPTPQLSWSDAVVNGWNNVAFQGTSGIDVQTALGGLVPPGSGALVKALWRFLNETQTWKRNLYFPGGGSNIQIETVENGDIFWLLK